VDLIGRDDELARVRAFLVGSDGGPTALLIEGDPGIGKTALWEAALADASAPRLLKVRCVEAETGLAYSGLADLLGRWTQLTLPALPPPLRQALEMVLLHVDAGNEAVEPHAVGRAVLEALRVLAKDAWVVLAIDDVQWLDPASERVLRFALRRLDTERVGVLATRRGTGGSFPLGLGDVLPAASRDRVRLAPLPTASLAAVLDRRFGDRLTRTLRARVLGAAGGNPLYAVELAAAQSLTEGRHEELTMPTRLEEVLTARVGQLPTVAVEPLAAVASLATPTVAQILAVLGESARLGLDHALDSGVIHVEEGRLRLAHPLHGIAALNRLAPSTRRRLHARLAGSARDAEERARHLVIAADGPDPSAAALVEEGANLARSRGAPEVAAELACAAVRLTPPDQVDEVRRRQLAAGYHWVTAGDISRGRALLAAALDGLPPGPTRAELQWRVAMITSLEGHIAEAVTMMEEALVEAGDRHALRAMVATRLSGLALWQCRGDDTWSYVRLAVEEAEIAGDPEALLRALTGYAGLTYLSGEALPDGLRDRIEHLNQVVGPSAPHEDPELGLAAHDLAAGDTDRAAERIQRVHHRAVEQGDELGIAWASGMLVEVELVAGRWQRARRIADELRLATRDDIGLPIRAAALLCTATVNAYVGDVEAAWADAVTLLEMARSWGVCVHEINAHTLLGLVALSRGDARGAHAEFDQVFDRLRRLRVREPTRCFPVWYDLDALVELGELDQAWALAADLDERGRTLGRPFALAIAAHARGLVQAARGDLAAARADLERALAEHDRLGWPFERARTLLALGIVLRRGKHKRAAREASQQALAIFEQLGARLWSARAITELSRIGGRPAATGLLTPTERRVAELVADGHTNREVADRLFLSPKTVAAHLTAVYAKVGVHSRTELSRYLRDHPLPGPRG
jgi:DNA-binding CsgD family transcriptional regulator